MALLDVRVVTAATGLLLAASMAQAASPAPAPASPVKAVTKPSVELLEFLAEWSEQDAELLDSVPAAAKGQPAPRPPATASTGKGGR